MKRKLVLDFESFFDTASGFTIDSKKKAHVSLVEYVRSPKFKVHGFGYQWLDEGKTVWVTGSKAAGVLAAMPWNEIDLIAHNLKFDGFILKEHYGHLPASFICTKAMSKAVLGKRVSGHSLSKLAKHFGFEDKGQMKTDGLRDLTPEQEAELAVYCIHDVDLDAGVYLKLKDDFPESQYRPMNWTIKMFVTPRLVLDVPLLETTAKEEAERKKNIFAELGIAKPVFSSNPKFMALLKKEGFEAPMKPSKKKMEQVMRGPYIENPLVDSDRPLMIPALALGDEAFKELRESDNERLQLLCEARVAAKSTILETRSGRLAKIGKTGTWPFDVEFSGADRTHRYSGGGAAGGNPQNFVRGSALRKGVKAPEGEKLVVGDFSKVEPRLVANLSKDPMLLQALEGDPYMDFASNYFKRKLDKKTDEAAYKYGKESIIALGYGMGHNKFRTRIKMVLNKSITEEEAKETVTFYRERYQAVPDLWYKLGGSIGLMMSGVEGQLLDLPVRYGRECLILPSGLRLQYPNLRQEMNERGKPEWVFDIYVRNELEKKRLYGGFLLENICQALAGELTKAAIDKFDDEAVGQVHDEALLLVDEFIADDVAKELEAAMSESPTWMPKMKLKAEVGVGSNWLDAKR